MTGVVIRCGGFARDGSADYLIGQYLNGFDPDAHGGGGEASWTRDKEAAMLFPDAGQALAFYRTQSTIKPTRSDGLPNRPLTAFNVTFDEA